MKVPASVRLIYEKQLESNKRLRARVDQFLQSRKQPRWHYESRLKSAESFLLKLETGRFPNPENLEDFFACTLVVENAGAIAAAEKLARDLFHLHSRRPRRDDLTHKRPDSFPFDDLRLYVSWQDDPALPPTGLTSITFEIQIKTFLQHAWSIATHDLIYKSDQTSWPKERIAYQVKALLEHAETSIQEADRLAETHSLKKTDRATEDLSAMIGLIKELWDATLLPNDVRRLAENVKTLCDACDVKTATLREILELERKEGRGPITLNVSPFGAVVRALIQHQRDRFLQLLASKKKGSPTVVLPSEIEFPSDIDQTTCVNAVFL